MDRDNTEIGKYKIISQVGEGAMGVVYRALDPVLNRTVAIKVMSDAIARDDDLRGRFLREAQAAGSLQHPNVITIYDCGEVDGHLFIAMEFVEGEDLEEVLRKHAALSLVDKIDIIIDVLGGLAYAHKRGIVHRDIKPANIRIDEEGRARIMDFGIAHLSSSNMTRTGVMVGTPAYMAPEQIVGAAITPATDLFSVGAVLYELLTGVKPFHADTLQSVMYKIVSQPPPQLPINTHGIPAGMNDIILKALAKEPAQRYLGATEMANALTAVRAGLGRDAIASKSISLRSVIDTALADERAAKSRLTNQRGVVIGAVAAVILIAAVVVGLLWNRGRIQPAMQTAATQSATTPSVVRKPSDSSANVVQSSVPVADPATNATPPSMSKGSKGSKGSSPTPVTTAKSSKGATVTAAPVGPSTEELALFRSLRTTALDNRRRAADAGASADQLQPGDDHVKTADALVATGKVAEAADHLNGATTAWNAAERDARAAASAASHQRTSVADPPKTQTPPAAPAPAVSPPVVAPFPVAPLAPASNATADIRAAVAAYARAIESRDVAELRRAYPDITAQQASGFDQFFGSVRSLHANLAAGTIDVTGSTADAKLSGEYDYVTSAGKAEKQAVSFQATFRRDGGVWKLTSVR